MSDGANTFQLIASQASSSHPKLESLVVLLKEKFGLDAYTARVRLTGSGKALFGSGSREITTRLAGVLREHDYDCWVIQRTEVAFTPLRLRGLEINTDEVRLFGKDQVISLARGAHIVAVLADVSGKLEERALTRLAIQGRYKKADKISAMADEKMIESVFKGSPVLDIYILDNKGQPLNALRVFPARYNAKGLGDRMTMSATRNIMAIIALAREYAGHFSLHADFGLGRLPGCQVKNLEGQFLDESQVLKRLTCFGWLMCDLEQDQGPVGKDQEEADPALAAVAVAAGQPALAAAIASGNMNAMSGLKEVVEEVRAAVAEEEVADERSPADEWLPLPPDRPENKISGRMLLSVIGVFLFVGMFMLISQGNSSSLRTVSRYAVKAGAVPALFSAFFLWAGFYFIRLKRRIENTPTSKIRSMAMGLVEVHGQTVRKYALVSPMNQSPCVYYRLRKYRKDKNNRWILKSDIDSRHVPFLVDDGTGQVTVDPAGATVRAKTSRTGLPGEATLAFHGVSTDDSDEKWIEDIIFEGTSLYVLGFAEPLRKKSKGLRERTVEKLRDLKLDRKALQGYDADGDGQISEDEWQVARNDAEELALREHLVESSVLKKQEEHAVITRPTQRSLPFVIAEAAEEAHLVRKYWFISIPLIFAGMVSAAVSLYYLLKYLGV